MSSERTGARTNGFRRMENPAIGLLNSGSTVPCPHTTEEQVFLDGERDLAKLISDSPLPVLPGSLSSTRFQGEIEPYLKIENHAKLKLGRSPEDTFFLALKAMLVSPTSFTSRKKKRDERLNSFETANRLSHFCGPLCLTTNFSTGQK